MTTLITLFIIAFSLSIDSFTVTLSLSILNINKLKMLLFSILVGIMHFFMPLIGYFFGNKIINLLSINSNLLLGIILFVIAIEIIISLYSKENHNYSLNIASLLFLSIIVSIDSLSVGMGIRAITTNILISSFIFSMVALLITYSGFLIGKYFKNIIGKKLNILSASMLIILAIFYIFK